MRRFNDPFLDGGVPVRKRGGVTGSMDEGVRALAEATEQLLALQKNFVASVTDALLDAYVECSACGYTCKALMMPSDRACVECGARLKACEPDELDERERSRRRIANSEEDDVKREADQLAERVNFVGRGGVGRRAALEAQARKNLSKSADRRLDKQLGPRVLPKRDGGVLDGQPVPRRKKSPRIL